MIFSGNFWTIGFYRISSYFQSLEVLVSRVNLGGHKVARLGRRRGGSGPGGYPAIGSSILHRAGVGGCFGTQPGCLVSNGVPPPMEWRCGLWCMNCLKHQKLPPKITKNLQGIWAGRELREQLMMALNQEPSLVLVQKLSPDKSVSTEGGDRSL